MAEDESHEEYTQHEACRKKREPKGEKPAAALGLSMAGSEIEPNNKS